MNTSEKLSEFFKILDEAEAYGRTVGKLSFDLECNAPKEGMDQAGKDMALVGTRIFELTHSEKYVSLLTELYNERESLTFVQKKAIERLYENYSKTKNFSKEFSYEYDLAANDAYTKWLDAKEKSDYSVFLPSFEKMVGFTKKAIDLRDGKKVGTYYDVCLSDNEKGGSIAQLDKFFSELSGRIIPLLERIKKDGKHIRDDFLYRPCAIEKQEKLSRYLMEIEGLRKDALVFATTEHPFTTNFGLHDVRVTTHFFEENFVSNIFTTLHEGGHALLMQNEPEEYEENHNTDGATNGMHECISRFYENIIGRSEAFIHFIYPKMQEIAGDTFSDVSERELYEAVNIASPGLIRCDADELTYCLHIMIRYECEKAFINGDITFDKIPQMWNALYKKYLGLDVPDDARGCLQDVHWSGGYGYFPSYALGNAYGAQIFHTMNKDFDVYGAVREGKLSLVADWLKEKVFCLVSVTDPDEWIVKITNEPLNTKYYLDYLEGKFTKLYELSDR